MLQTYEQNTAGNNQIEPVFLNPIQKGPLRDCCRMVGGEGAAGHPLSSVDMRIFSSEISKFCYIKKYKYR